MLRFRPIAPKPIGGESASRGAEQERRKEAVKKGRTAKRRYFKSRGRQSKRRIKDGEKSLPPKKSGIEVDLLETRIVTLQLLPERSETDHKSCNNTSKKIQEDWNNYKADAGVNYKTADFGRSGVRTAELRSVQSVNATWIIVEGVTDKFTDSGALGLGFSDKERINNLQLDTCPGFISDCRNNVVWGNEAYKKMVAENEFTAWLVVKERLPYFCPSFACRVRLIQHTGHGHKCNRMVPCDVWRMEFAGFAWKLDVSTALGLGL